jgi:hypothetical protein
LGEKPNEDQIELGEFRSPPHRDQEGGRCGNRQLEHSGKNELFPSDVLIISEINGLIPPHETVAIGTAVSACDLALGCIAASSFVFGS